MVENVAVGSSETIAAFLAQRAAGSPAAPALLVSGREPLAYASLWRLVQEGAAALRSAGVCRADRVAVVAPDGAEMAALFLTVASAASCAPLNPRYRAEELDFYLGDLKPSALVVPVGFATPAREVAARRGVAVLELEPSGVTAGSFHLNLPAGTRPAEGRPAVPGDVALVLHTSGTTSRPKMVPLTHANLCASAASIARTLALAPADRCLSVMPLFHIHGLVGVLLSSLYAGAGVFCTEGFVAPRFLDELAESGATWYSAVPTMHQAVLARALADPERLRGHRLRLIRSSSASLPPAVMAGLEETFGVPVIESYGMTEAAHQMASNPLPPSPRKPGSVGPAAGPEVAIMDASGRRLPQGSKGEIVIRGPNVTRGYEANPEANAKAFVGGWFRTGDEGTLDGDGYLFLTGRLKELINRGGEKIAPREIDEVLLAHPAVAQALAFAAPHPALGEEIAAAVVLRPGEAVEERELQAFAATRLADFKLPRRIVFLDEIPKGPTGKLQRIGLAGRLGVGFDAPTPADPAYAAPSSPVEAAIAAIWADVLEVDRVGVHDDFFALGGDSMLATRVLARVGQELGVEVPFTAFFGSPTVAAMAAGLEIVASRQPPIPHVDRGVPLRPSFTQERMWFLERLEPGLALYNRPLAVRLRGALDGAALSRALDAVVARHEVLRARLPEEDGVPVMLVADELHLDLPLTDLSAAAERERGATLASLLREEGARPFDLAGGPLLRGRLVRLAGDDHVLALTFHHAVFDGASAGVLLRDLAALYDAAVDGIEVALPALPIQYADWAAWQRREVEERVATSLLPYWMERLAGAPQVLDLPLDRPRPPVRSYRGAGLVRLVPPELGSRLSALARERGTTLFTVLLAAFATLLSRLAGQDDVLLGCPVSGRTRLETEPLIGAFINTLVLRVDLADGPSFDELLARCRDTVQGALAHQELPIERLVEELKPERDLLRSPIFQVLFQLRSLHEAKAVSRRLAIDEERFDRGVAASDLALDVKEREDGLECRFTYAAELFEDATIARLAEDLETLLRAAVDDPGRRLAAVPRPGGERRGAGPVAVPGRTGGIAEPIGEQARRTPGAVAVISGAATLSYGELDRASARVAAAVEAGGAGRGDLVGVMMPRGADVVAALLGVLRAGAAYLPLDPAWPDRRIAALLEEARPAMVLTGTGWAGRIIAAGGRPLPFAESAGAPTTDSVGSAAPGDLAYVIYTSGSTGRPKGVMVEHGGVLGIIAYVREVFGLGAGDTVLAIAPLTFDASVREVFAPLAAGARLVVASGEETRDPAATLEAIERHAVTCLLALTPTRLRELVREAARSGTACPSIRVAGLTGEPLTAADCRAAARLFPAATLVNQYGPTEVTMLATYHVVGAGDMEGDGPVPIGRPIPGRRVTIVDESLRAVADGVAGEIVVGGEGVARGYVGAVDAIAGRFVTGPAPDGSVSRVYRTGDRGRRHGDGVFECLGRLDREVKVAGVRVAPEEVEAALRLHPAVHEAVVVPAAPGLRSLELVAHVVAACPVTVEALRDHVSERLPAVMVPSRIVLRTSLPRTESGKVNPAALAAEQAPASPDPAPSPAVADAVVAAWREVLGRNDVGPQTDFFEAGGHSLLVMRVLARLRQRLGVDVPVRVLFEATTVERFTEAVETLVWLREGDEGSDAGPPRSLADRRP